MSKVSTRSGNTQEGQPNSPSEDTSPLTDAQVEATMAAAYKRYATAVTNRSEKRIDHAHHLANLAQAGRDAGWSIRSLADPCGITPERLRQITKEFHTGAPLDVSFPHRVRPKKDEPVPKRKPVALTAAEKRELAKLAPIAKGNTGSRPLDSPFRHASERFTDLIITYHDRGVTWAAIAEATNGHHKVSGLRGRASRWGYNKGAAPSIAPYRGIDLHAERRKAALEAEAKRAAAEAAQNQTSEETVTEKDTKKVQSA